MANYVTKHVTEGCLNCGELQPFERVYLNGQLVETTCLECGITDSFGYDDEDDF